MSSKRERGASATADAGSPSTSGVDASKKEKTVEGDESASVASVEALCTQLGSSGGPELLVLVRKVLMHRDVVRELLAKLVLARFVVVTGSAVEGALSAVDLFVFGEILDVQCVAALRHSDDADARRHYSLLQLFAYGTYSDYASNRAIYGTLTAAQERKLRQLSFVSLGARHKRIPYDTLKEALQIYDVRELEDLLLDTFYAGLVAGKIDAFAETVCVEFTVGRDVREDELRHIVEVLEQWSGRATKLIDVIASDVNLLRGEIQKNAMERAQHEARVKDLVEQIAKTSLRSGARRGGEGSEDDDGAAFGAGLLHGDFGVSGGLLNRRRDKGRKRNGQ